MNHLITIKIMTLNTWLGSTAVKDGKNKLIKAVELSGADIVGFQEAPDPGKETAEKLGWYYYQDGQKNCSIISKYPIIEAVVIEGISAILVKIQLPSEQEILVANAHLYYEPYGPYWAMFNNKNLEDILTMENQIRGKEMSVVLKELSQYFTSDMAMFLMGDFNSPSHLDWGDDMKSGHNELIVEWPVTLMAEKAGLIDSYRAIHPNPVTSPGYTWSPVYTLEHPWGDHSYEPQDRIDFIYFRALVNVKVLNSEVFVVGKPMGYGSHEDNEWPSDHAAVVTTFYITPIS
jgi:endonuclease/exonuclease/phosphatase family metal-dependent hydrolase